MSQGIQAQSCWWSPCYVRQRPLGRRWGAVRAVRAVSAVTVITYTYLLILLSVIVICYCYVIVMLLLLCYFCYVMLRYYDILYEKNSVRYAIIYYLSRCLLLRMSPV